MWPSSTPSAGGRTLLFAAGCAALRLVAACAAPGRPPAAAVEDRPALPSDVTPAQWSSSLTPLLPALVGCKAHHPTTGHLEVSIDVATDGTVAQVLAYGAGSSTALRECVATVFRRGRYPVSRAGAYHYLYPLAFR